MFAYLMIQVKSRRPDGTTVLKVAKTDVWFAYSWIFRIFRLTWLSRQRPSKLSGSMRGSRRRIRISLPAFAHNTTERTQCGVLSHWKYRGEYRGEFCGIPWINGGAIPHVFLCFQYFRMCNTWFPGRHVPLCTGSPKQTFGTRTFACFLTKASY